MGEDWVRHGLQIRASGVYKSFSLIAPLLSEEGWIRREAETGWSLGFKIQGSRFKI
jgi:hypothetical protein